MTPSSKPVSYTHLDVYKRQGLLPVTVKFFQHRRHLGRVEQHRRAELAGTPVPVSYTHLDVYKRQAS